MKRADVEAWCRSEGFDVTWMPDGGLHVSKLCPAVVRQPGTERHVWFNALQTLETLATGYTFNIRLHVDCEVDQHRLRTDLRAIQSAFRGVQVIVPCEAGDVLLLDNSVMAHGLDRASSQSLSLVHEFNEGRGA